jgi:hypothetical protein
MTKEICLAHSGIEASIQNIKEDIDEIKESQKETKDLLIQVKTKLDTMETKTVSPATLPAAQFTPEEVSFFKNIMIHRNGWIIVAVGLLEAVLRIKL